MTSSDEQTPPSDNLFDGEAFGARIRQKLAADRTSFREAAPIVPCSPATLNRAARCEVPDVENYLRITRWLSGASEPDPVGGKS